MSDLQSKERLTSMAKKKCTCKKCTPDWHCHCEEGGCISYEDCLCDRCTGKAHCHKNYWMTVDGVGLCPRCSELPLHWLKAQKVIAVGQSCDLVFEGERTRIWLSRCAAEDGEPYNNKVTVETWRDNGLFEVYRYYEAR